MKTLKLGLSWHTVLLVILVLTSSAGLMDNMILQPARANTQPNYDIQQLARSARERPLLKALMIMHHVPQAQGALSHIVSTPVRLVFKNMETLNKGLKNYDAISWLSPAGEQFVFINEIHKTAPPEALAALISHEAMHSDRHNSVAEEIAGWQTEATVWQILLKAKPNLKTCTNRLCERQNGILEGYTAGNLDELVRNNPGYRGLPAHSPGY
ncbi:MAG: hypothetical protein AAGI66_01015 [Cyanobacteria bacterium P01_H01_bin.74]